MGVSVWGLSRVVLCCNVSGVLAPVAGWDLSGGGVVFEANHPARRSNRHTPPEGGLGWLVVPPVPRGWTGVVVFSLKEFDY